MPHRSGRDIAAYVASSLFVGGIYLGVLFVMDSLLGASTALSVTVSYAGAMLVYFLLSKLAVFKSPSRTTAGREFVQFTIIVTVNYFLTQLIVHGIEALTGNVYLGSVVAGVVTISLTYMLFDRVVFRRR